MSQNDPLEPKKDEPSIDLTKAQEAAERAADETAQTINQYFGTELQSSSIHRITGAVASIALTAGVAYFAGKRGVKAGMKDYLRAGQSLVDAAGNYADISAQNALITAENAAKSHEEIVRLNDGIAKAVKNLKK